MTFHDVRILDAQGKLKKVVPGKKLSKKYWSAFYSNVKKKVTPNLKKGKVRKSAIYHLQNDEYSLD